MWCSFTPFVLVQMLSHHELIFKYIHLEVPSYTSYCTASALWGWT